jgi:transposase-like protein
MDLKRVYRAATEDEALLELERFSEIWYGQYPQILKSWRNHWQNLNTLLSYPEDIRKAIYTTNAIESLNSVFRKAIKKRKPSAVTMQQEKWFTWQFKMPAKMDNAHSKVAPSYESLYYRV